ncbi:MAG: 2-oxoglutarate dehydrogenase E1 component, partial [Flavobacteriaceae bacterium]|nr:2-oxoglutarate dehydrogenase E1 component [Flavobacteriaceae bacterium]
LAPNPSHLESVGPVVQGITRAKQDKYFEGEEEYVLPVIIHGDAALAAQGVVYEVVQMERLKGYKTNGTIHIVVNNQIGFTTNYIDGRSSTYCSDVGKVNLCPILHVNADDVEAVVHASSFALEYRMKFKRDIFIDLLGYRKYGHNEGDEPRFTQPKLYKAISKQPDVKTTYANKLIAEKVISKDDYEKMQLDYKNTLDEDLENSKKNKNVIITPFMQHEWVGMKRVKSDAMLQDYETSVEKNNLDKIAESIFNLKTQNKFLKKVVKLMNDRKKMYFEDDKIDWAIAEMLAYGSILNESYNVRISGQDVERGTFSHRHAILKDEESEENFIPLNHLNKFQGNFEIYNSPLSEYGVMGFEYGYALSNPNTLTIWEAQFGDFSNGAQIMIDQYLSAAEDKWKLQNGLVLMLPHGYEGQGAEHSSARMERFLQLCAKNNMYVANCTTPSNLFHVLRRQIVTNFRKPLILFTPKSLLRHPKVISTKKDLVSGTFLPVIDDNINTKKVKSLVFCTGKFYYDLVDFRDKNNIDNVALVRIEQLFPLPVDEIMSLVNKYETDDIVWAQEEPRNMGSWSHLLVHLDIAKTFRVASRRFYGSPASGSPARFTKRHSQVIKYVFDISKDNFK